MRKTHHAEPDEPRWDQTLLRVVVFVVVVVAVMTFELWMPHFGRHG